MARTKKIALKSTGGKASRKQPPPPPPPPKMSLHEHLYKDPIDYTGEHLVEAFSFKPIFKNNNEYFKLYGIDVEELQKQREQAFVDFDNCNNDHDKAVCDTMIESTTKACIAAVYSNEKRTMFKEKKCSVTTITQQAQIEQEQEDNDSSTIIEKENKDNNVFNELITYYNNGGGG